MSPHPMKILVFFVHDLCPSADKESNPLSKGPDHNDSDICMIWINIRSQIITNGEKSLV